MRIEAERAGVLVAAMALATGCGDAPSATGSVADLAQGICDVTFRCCDTGEAAYQLGPFVDEASCGERLLRAAELGDATGFVVPAGNGMVMMPNVAVLDRAVEEGRVEVDATALDACLDYLRHLPCNQYETPVEPTVCVRPDPPEPDLCESALLFRGLVAEGGACSSPGTSLECKTGLACLGVASLGVAGVCVARGEEGEFCFDDGDCGPDLYCSLLDGTCRFPGGEGDACAYADRDDPSPDEFTLLLECAEGLYCDPVTDACVAPCERGARCYEDVQCDEAFGLRCIMRRCDLPRVIGSQCEQPEDCEDGLRCALPPVGGTGLVCQELLADGLPCDLGNSADCASGYCSPNNWLCAPTAPPGGLCPSGLASECAGGYCESAYVYCEEDAECEGSGHCNQVYRYCEYYCVELLPAGTSCNYGYECESQACVAGECRDLPLGYGEPCTSDLMCGSEFCNFEEDRYCDLLPLPDGMACTANAQCESDLCYGNECVTGLTEGMDCSNPGGTPCGRDYYCDWDVTTATCRRRHEPGATCEGSDQCRGNCVARFGRYMCDDTPAYRTAVCDGD